MDELLNNEKFTFPVDKYTVEEFFTIYNERVQKLYEDLPILETKDIDSRFRHLYEDCPIGLFIDNFGLERKLDEEFPGWSNNIIPVVKRKYVIKIGEINKNEEKSFLRKIVEKFKKGS